MTTALHALAGAVGLLVDWEDAGGRMQTVSDPALVSILLAMGYPCETESACVASLALALSEPPPALLTVTVGGVCRLPGPAGPGHLVLESGEVVPVILAPGAPGEALFKACSTPGYHRLELGDVSFDIAVCPPRADGINDRLGRRGWGATAQVYSVRDRLPRGFGDFGALKSLAASAAAEGADALAISPVHALFLADPERFSPYSPSSRDALNVLYADLGPFFEAGASDALIDWSAASPEKVSRLRSAYLQFAGDPAFDAFVSEGGLGLWRHAVFEALHRRFFDQIGAGGWPAWPVAYHDPEGAAVAAFEREAADEIRFHLFCQWRADASLGVVQATALEGGMGIGLIADLAVGLDPGGAHAWSRRDELLSGLTIGAPPDAFQAAGQGWGITSFSPAALRREGYQPFLRTVRSALRHAGGLRIDHALGLNRLWVLPHGASPLDGAYLQNPFEDLLRLLALESWRAGAVIIGEDLGVVPAGLRATLAAHGILGMRVLPFERITDGGFRPPAQWDVTATALTSTHDLPPVAGWWRERDIDWRERLGAGGDRTAERLERTDDRAALWQAAVLGGLIEGAAPKSGQGADDVADGLADSAVDAAIALVTASASDLALIPIEDLLGLEDQVNLPGITEVHPNWRRRLPVSAETLFLAPATARRVRLLKKERSA